MRISAENMSTYFKTGHSDGNKHRKQNSADSFVIIADIDKRIRRLKALSDSDNGFRMRSTYSSANSKRTGLYSKFSSA
jgi:hypothetical protein